MPITPKRMPFFEHLDELRKRLAIIAGIIFVGPIVLYSWAWPMYDWFMAPIIEIFGDENFITINPFENFTLKFKISLYATIVLFSPVIIWQVMAFFLPALKPKERKWVVPTFAAMVVLFAAGVVFCHQVVVPAAFEWMVSQAGESITVMPSASTYFQGAILLVIAFGIGFQLPVVVFYLVLFDIVPYAKLRANWRVAYIIMMVVAAVATPDWSPVTMAALFGALLVLYEASLLLARVLLSKRIAAQRAAEED